MLQDPDLIIHRLRLRYLSQIQDGIGERIIDFSHTKTNTTAFRIAGGDASLMDRCVSPDIPIHDASDTSHSLNMRNGLVSPVSNGLSEEAELGGTLRRTVTDLSLASKRSRNNLHEDFLLAKLNPALRDDEASDQSDISESEDIVGNHATYGSQQKHMFMIGLHKKIADEPKFEKIPIRRRGISDASVTYRSSIPPAVRKPNLFASQNGSESDLSRAGDRAQYSIISNGFMPVVPGAPFEDPLIRLAQPGTPDALDEFPDVLASFEVADDSSDDEYDVQASVPLAIPLAGDQLLSSAKPILTSSDAGQMSIGNIQKSRPRPESVFQPSSGLTALIKASETSEINPLERKYGIMNGKADLKPLRLKIYRPTSSRPSVPFEVVIKSTATVVDTIGYALLRYIEDKREPILLPEQKDPNYWTLRIVEDDGELDEDFPALERARPISKFSFDEFALVEASPAQLTEHQLLSPDPLGVKTNMKTVPEVQVQPPSKPSSSNSRALNTPTTADATISSATPSFAPSTITASTPSTSIRPTARAPGASVLLKVRLRPEPGAPNLLQSQVTALDVTTETYLGDVLDQVCKRRNLDKYMFSLRLPGSNIIAPSDRTVESLQGLTELLLVRKKAMDLLTDTGVARSMVPNAPIMASTYAGSARPSLGEPSSLGQYIPDLVTSNTYQHWMVWRRQPMSFMGRHERILAIDGEYVHVSPTESKTMFESPKTSSIHVGQIVACKQSRKMPANFKVVIIKAGQTKRYDFEAARPQESEMIVSKIKTLTRNWSANRGTRQSRLVAR